MGSGLGGWRLGGRVLGDVMVTVVVFANDNAGL